MTRQRITLSLLIWTVCGGTLLIVLAALWLQYLQVRALEREARQAYGLYGIMGSLAANIKANVVQADSQYELFVTAPSRSNRDAGYTRLRTVEGELSEFSTLLRSSSRPSMQDMNALLIEMDDNISELLQLILQTHELMGSALEAHQKLFDFMLVFDQHPLTLPPADTPERQAGLVAFQNALIRIRVTLLQAIVMRDPSSIKELDGQFEKLETLASSFGPEQMLFADPDLNKSAAPDMLRQYRQLVARLSSVWDQLALLSAESRVLGQRNIIAASRIMENSLLMVNQARIEQEASFAQTRMRMIAFAVLAALLCMGGLTILLLRLTQPLRRLTQYSLQAANGHAPQDLPVFATPELDALASSTGRAVSQLISRLEHADKDKQSALESCLAARNELAARNAFLNYVGHEIRTPANGILGLLYLCRKLQLDPALADYLGKIQLAAESQLAVLNNMLDFSRMESDSLALERAPFSLSRVLGDLRDMVIEPVREKSLDFDIKIERGVPDKLVGDPMRLRQILQHLTSNAIKFTEQGSVKINVSLAEDSLHDPGLPDTFPRAYEVALHFSILDTGIGIPADMLHRLFEPFQLDSGGPQSYASNGLGLSIANRLAHLMRGRIWVRSQPQVGSEFHFTIVCSHAEHPDEQSDGKLSTPVKSAPPRLHGDTRATATTPNSAFPTQEAQADADPLKPDDSTAPQLGGFHVLLVEDDAISRQIATELLQSCGLEVTSVHTGAHAVELLRKQPFALVFMDIQMPVMDGLEATRRIRALAEYGFKVPIIAMTAHTLDEDRQRCFEAGMQGYITKPIQVDALHTLLRRYLQIAPAIHTTSSSSAEAAMTTLDVSLGLHHLNGNEQLYNKLLRRFADSNAQVAQEIQTAFEGGDMETAIRVAHTLKGVSASLGASNLHELSLQVEQSLKDGSYTSQGADLLKAEMDLVIAAVNARLG